MPPRSESDRDILIRLDERMKSVAEQVEAIHYVVYGNGEPGLKGNVKTLMDERAERKWVRRTVVGALIGLAVTTTATSVVLAVKVVARVDAMEAKSK